MLSGFVPSTGNFQDDQAHGLGAGGYSLEGAGITVWELGVTVWKSTIWWMRSLWVGGSGRARNEPESLLLKIQISNGLDLFHVCNFEAIVMNPDCSQSSSQYQ